MKSYAIRISFSIIGMTLIIDFLIIIYLLACLFLILFKKIKNLIYSFPFPLHPVTCFLFPSLR